ncbi:MAG: phosphoenolpyruvate--protein phosphotransferase [Lachnospiraceae bacterium]|nr:phosphoenolpyruvate--protein phosphotransferase [Lachnospiraceae bacterium]
MKRLQGLCASDGIAIGTVKIYQGSQPEIMLRRVQDVQRELALYQFAAEEAAAELERVYRQAIREVGKQAAEIFEAQLMLLQDASFGRFIQEKIVRERVNAAYAVYCAGEHFAAIFNAMPDELTRARRMDMKDISGRIISLLEQKDGAGAQPEAHIIVCREITPGAVMALRSTKVLAYITENGSYQSHAAILARSMGIPAVTGVDVSTFTDGMEVAVDGDGGCVYQEPDEDIRKELLERVEASRQREQARRTLIGTETVTLSGQKVALYANIGSREEVAAVREQDGEGIGLLRTEFLFLGRSRMPEEEEQYRTYQYIVEQMQGKPVVIRTLDIGGDKPAKYLPMEPEENPALGCRGIRTCLQHRALFMTQLRAILRAAAKGPVSVMFPMITSVEEVRQAKACLEAARQSLETEGIAHGRVLVGIMVETPAAVMLSRELAEVVDFFSIGTNDLTQYTLAADLQNTSVQVVYDTHHPAIMKMIEQVVAGARQAGIPVSICGELGADTTVTEALVHMGIHAFSVNPVKLLEIRERIRSIS